MLGDRWVCRMLLSRLIGFDREQVSEDLAFVVIVLRAVVGGVEHLLALGRWHVAQGAEGAAYLLLAGGVHIIEVLCGAADSLAALRSEAFEVFVAADRALALVGRHGIELVQAIDQALLLLLREAAESRLLAERVFLAGEGFTLVALQPVAQMLLVTAGRRDGVLVARSLRLIGVGVAGGSGHLRSLFSILGCSLIWCGTRWHGLRAAQLRNRPGSGLHAGLHYPRLRQARLRDVGLRHVRSGRMVAAAVMRVLRVGGGQRSDGEQEDERRTPRPAARRITAITRSALLDGAAGSCCAAPKHGSLSLLKAGVC